MTVFINDQPFTTHATLLSDVLREWQATPPFTVAVNNTFVPKHQHPHHPIESGDRIDVLTPIQGG